MQFNFRIRLSFGSVYFIVNTTHGAESERKCWKSKNTTTFVHLLRRLQSVLLWLSLNGCTEPTSMKLNTYKTTSNYPSATFCYIVKKLGLVVGHSIIFRLLDIQTIIFGFWLRTRSKNYEIAPYLAFNILSISISFLLIN